MPVPRSIRYSPTRVPFLFPMKYASLGSVGSMAKAELPLAAPPVAVEICHFGRYGAPDVDTVPIVPICEVTVVLSGAFSAAYQIVLQGSSATEIVVVADAVDSVHPVVALGAVSNTAVAVEVTSWVTMKPQVNVAVPPPGIYQRAPSVCMPDWGRYPGVLQTESVRLR